MRKIFYLMPEYLENKNSLKNNSQYCGETKNKIINSLKIPTESYIIYNSQKANG
jgi:hypothetical protein